MDLVTVLLVVVGMVLPSVTKVIDSIAYRNRAAADTRVIKARRGRKGSHEVPDSKPASRDELGDLFAAQAERIVVRVRQWLRDAGVPEAYVDAERPGAGRLCRRSAGPTVISATPAPTSTRSSRGGGGLRTALPPPGTSALSLRDEQLLPDCADAVISRLAVRRAVRALQQRAAVWATQAMDQPQAEYAAAAGRAPGTVGVHVMRAVRVLRAGTGGYCRRSRCDGVRPGRRGDPPLLGGQQARPPARREGRVIDWLATVATVIGLTMAGIVLLSLTALGITRGTARRRHQKRPGRNATVLWCDSCQQYTEAAY
ncbi:hypothetical protein [Streptomyces sp. KL116D]|uniref:hypothetical protein n=1 Tax=Streptomyces sp. KL116D TaxID=3045152 RepID=UPI0035583426